MTKIKHIPHSSRIPVLVIDSNYHSRDHLYARLAGDPKYLVTKLSNIKQVFEHEKFFDSYRLLIMNPHMASYGHYDDGENKTLNGRLTGLFLYRDKFQHRQDLKVFVYGLSIEEALENWGDNVVRRFVIPKDKYRSFHRAAKEIFK